MHREERGQVEGARPRRARLRRQKANMGLFIRTIGIRRAEAKIILANLAFNMQRLIFHETRAATG